MLRLAYPSLDGLGWLPTSRSLDLASTIRSANCLYPCCHVQVYFVVAILRHAQSHVVDAALADMDLTDLLDRGEALEGFDLEAALSYVEVLAERYHGECEAAMTAYLHEDIGG